MEQIKKGNVFVISAASGTGKTTLIKELIAEIPDVHLSISHTTRSPRDGEVDGKHYHFSDKKSFLEMVGEGEFLEFAEVHDNYYGTHNDEVFSHLSRGEDVILEIDVQGAFQVKRKFEDCIMIFVLPPTMDALAERLRGRHTDSDEVINKRLKNARKEFEEAFSYDYLVVNDDFNEAKENLKHIILAERSNLERNKIHLIHLLG